MSKERFERLKQSIIETGQTLRGEREPSREFTYEIKSPPSTKNSSTYWAICITDEEDALIPLKLYEVKYSKNNRISVVDEGGERLVCPASWFMRVHLAPEQEERIAELAS